MKEDFDYEEMSDFEINKAVAVKLGYQMISNTPVNLHSVRANTITFDWCHNWDLCGGLMTIYNIGLVPTKLCIPDIDDCGWKTIPGWVASTDVANLYVDENPLRAVAIMFLIMKVVSQDE